MQKGTPPQQQDQLIFGWTHGTTHAGVCADRSAEKETQDGKECKHPDMYMKQTKTKSEYLHIHTQLYVHTRTQATLSPALIFLYRKKASSSKPQGFASLHN